MEKRGGSEGDEVVGRVEQGRRLRRRLAGKGDAEVRVEMAGKDDGRYEAGRWERRSNICEG